MLDAEFANDFFIDALDMATSTLLVPPRPTGTVAPIPTIVPTPPEFQHAHKTGHTALWVVFALMLLSSATFTALSWRIPLPRRLFHVLTTLVTLTAALSYFAMATGGGYSWRCARHETDAQPDPHHVVCRPVYWARYVDWALTTPLLVVDLALLAGLPGGNTLMAVAGTEVMVWSGLFAALGRGDVKAQTWGWFSIGCVGFLAVIWHVGVIGGQAVKARGNAKGLFTGLGALTLVLWILYPIVWGVGDGSRRISVDSEIVAFAALDVLAKGAFGFWLLLAHRRVKETNIEVDGYWADGLTTAEGRIRLLDPES